MIKLIRGECVEEMAKMPENSVDAVVCDPPYLISFMSKKWDKAESGKAMQDVKIIGHHKFGRL